MLANRMKEQKLGSGEELRGALCTATNCMAPQRFDSVMLNRLLDFSALPREDPRKDPLALKQELASFDASLAKLTLKQRKSMMVALDTQISQCKRYALPERFEVEGGWPPKEPEPEPPRRAPKPSDALVVSPTPLFGEGDGFTWAQTEVDLTVTIPVPEGTGKQEILMQLTPKVKPPRWSTSNGTTTMEHRYRDRDRYRSCSPALQPPL